MIQKRKEESEKFSIFLISFLIIFFIVGYDIINPTNIYWLVTHDPTQHYVGWTYYRSSPWTFPVGLNLDYGMEMGSGLIYAAPVPLLAIFFKVFSPILPDEFQYFGLWLVVCFLLQGWYAWKLLGLISDSAAVRLTGAGFFLFAPIMIQRMIAHPSLSSHFLILAALYYYLIQESVGRKPLAWSLILAGGTLSHTYILAMVFPIWIASLVKSYLDRDATVRKLSLELFGNFCAIVFLAWQAGYFVEASDPRTGGYGYLRANLLTMLDPNEWSRILPDIGTDHRGDQLGYPGLGSLVVILVGLPFLFRRDLQVIKSLKRHWFFCLTLAALVLFAVTHNVGIGPYTIKLFDLNETVHGILSTFRASGRMVWPLVYLIVLGGIFLVVRSLPRRWVPILLGCLLVLQVVDTNAGWSGFNFRHKKAPAHWVDALKSPFWEMVAGRYEKVRFLLPEHNKTDWQVVSYFAARHGMPTNAISLARTDIDKWNRARDLSIDLLHSGEFDEDTLYFLDEAAFNLAQLSHDPLKDLVVSLDGVSVLAPGLILCEECAELIKGLPHMDPPSRIAIGEEVTFSRGAESLRLLVPNWVGPQDWGIWSLGERARMLLPWEGGIPEAIRFKTLALVSESHPIQRVGVLINDVLALEVVLTDFRDNEFVAPVPQSVIEASGSEGLLRIELILPDAVGTKEAGVGEGDTPIAIGLRTVVIE